MKYSFDNPENVRRAVEAAHSASTETRLDVWSVIVEHLTRQTVTGKVSFQLLAALRSQETQRATLVQLGCSGFRILPIRAALALLAVPPNPPAIQAS